MNPPDDPQRNRPSTLSAEALVGIGITVGAFGLLFLLLGWAQHMREVKGAAVILLAIGAVMFVIGSLTALSGSRRRS